MTCRLRRSPLFVGVAARQELSRTAQVQASLSRPGGIARLHPLEQRGAFHPTVAAALASIQIVRHNPSSRATEA